MIKIKKTILCLSVMMISTATAGIALAYPASNYSYANSTEITMTEAEDIALKHAGLKRADVEFLNQTTYRQNKIRVHKLVFRTSSHKYVYKINASTGAIIASHKNSINNNSKTNTTTISITKEKAKSIAFSKAGVKASSVTNLQVKLNKDDNKMVYQIKFTSGNVKYKCTIDAQTGEILTWKSEKK